MSIKIFLDLKNNVHDSSIWKSENLASKNFKLPEVLIEIVSAISNKFNRKENLEYLNSQYEV